MKKIRPRDKRRKRVPVGGMKRKLYFPPIEGYETRVVNDVGNRLQDFVDGGWEFVESSDTMGDKDVSNETGINLGSKVSKAVGKNEDGSPIIGYLMKIKREWYIEDQKEKAKKIDEMEEAILKGDDAATTNVENRYVPK